MERLSVSEKIEIIRIIGDNTRSFRETAREFNRRHRNRPPISMSTVSRINRIFNDTGSVSISILKRDNNTHRDNWYDERVLEYFRLHPQVSLRVASVDLNINKDNIHRCLKKNNIKPFKPKFPKTSEKDWKNVLK
ncbi:hypothetical protein ABEB36_015714 [Hypothenemus hampei]|uniref:DUF4817 domain-containing protein n=1 Tax=Hypothenemus hampei TaxID=57062 RepID=A0ABD1DZ54_HYPHA